jgi:hypothetical protein
MGQLKSSQIKNNSLTGASFIRNFKMYDETESLTAGTNNLRFFNGIFYLPVNNITGVTENDLSQIPTVSSDWVEASKRFLFKDVSSDYNNTQDWQFDIMNCNTSSGDITLTFPSNLYSTILQQGEKRFFFNTGTGVVDINTNTQTIDGISSVISIGKDGYLELEFIGNEFKVIRYKNTIYKKHVDDIPNLELWLDASTLTGSNGVEITTWNDSSTNNRNFTGSTGATPKLSVASQNGLNTTVFDGTDDIMSGGDLELYNNSRGFTMVAVVKAVDSNRRAVMSKYQTTGDNREFAFGNGVNYLFEDLTWGSATDLSISLTSNTFQILTLRWKPGEAFNGYINGNLVDTGSAAVTDMSDGTANLILGGGDYTGVGFWSGEIAEVALYSDSVSDLDLQNLRNNLSLKWGLNLDIVGEISDNYAVHVNKANEISSLSSKLNIDHNDVFIIEDSEDSNNKKKVNFNSILKGSPIIHVDATSGSATITEMNKVYYIQAYHSPTALTIPDVVVGDDANWIRIIKESGNGIITIRTTSGQNIGEKDFFDLEFINDGVYLKGIDALEYEILYDTDNQGRPININAIDDYDENEDWIFDTLEFNVNSNKTATFNAQLTSIMKPGERRFIVNSIHNLDTRKIFVNTNGIFIDGSTDTFILSHGGFIEFQRTSLGALEIIRQQGVYRGFSVTGNGTDGSLTVGSANTVVNIYTSLSDSSISYPDDSITVADATGFSAGDEIMFHQVQTSTGTPGIYDFHLVQSVSGNTINFSPPIARDYYSGTFGGLQNEATQIIRVPNYTDVTISSGASITSTPWVSANGYGGVVVFRVQNKLIFDTGNLGIVVDNQGFKGGEDNGGGNDAPGDPGESEVGFGWLNDATTDNCDPNGSGGGGGYGPSGYGGTGGGGGGHLLSGGDATDSSGPPAIAKGGNAIGDDELTLLLFGGAGGGGGDDDNKTTPGAYGGNSGGIIYATATEMTSAFCSAKGEDGISGGTSAGGDGGGGAGGSIYLQALIYSQNTISVDGGAGGNDGSDTGGNGSSGIMKVPGAGAAKELDIIQLTKTSSQALANGVETDITWNVEDYISDSFSWSGAEITFLKKGDYKITIDAGADLSSGSTRSEVDWELKFDSGTSYVMIPGTYRGTYHRNSTQNKESISITKMIPADINNKLKLVAIADNNNLETIDSGCILHIERKR